MTRNKWLFTVVLMSGMCCALALTQSYAGGRAPDRDTTQQDGAQGGTEDDMQGGSQGGTMGEEQQGAEGGTAQRSTEEVLKAASQGEDITEEEAAMMVQSPDFVSQLQQSPEISDALADSPYAANQFYMQPEFKTWSTSNPDQAQQVMDAAMEWQQMAPEDKQSFYDQHPTLKGQGGAMGGEQQQDQNSSGTGQGGVQQSTGTTQGGAMGGTQQDGTSGCK